MTSLEREIQTLIHKITQMGYPAELGMMIAQNLRTEKMIVRMNAYLSKAKPRTDAEIVDEMMAIMEDRERWTQKKMAEYYNAKYNQLLNEGLPGDE